VSIKIASDSRICLLIEAMTTIYKRYLKVRCCDNNRDIQNRGESDHHWDTGNCGTLQIIEIYVGMKHT